MLVSFLNDFVRVGEEKGKKCPSHFDFLVQTLGSCESIRKERHVDDQIFDPDLFDTIHFGQLVVVVVGNDGDVVSFTRQFLGQWDETILMALGSWRSRNQDTGSF